MCRVWSQELLSVRLNQKSESTVSCSFLPWHFSSLSFCLLFLLHPSSFSISISLCSPSPPLPFLLLFITLFPPIFPSHSSLLFLFTLPPPSSSSLSLLLKDPSWDQVNLEVASSRKFKWLRERMGGSSPHTTLLNQIKNFVLTDEVDVRVLHNTLKRQVNNNVSSRNSFLVSVEM